LNQKVSSGSTKEKVLYLLKNNSNRYVSGQEIAEEIFVTRAAVWKAIKTLQSDGYCIEAITNRGYRLVEEDISIDSDSILTILNDKYSFPNDFELLIYDEVDSTNNVAKKYAEENPGRKAVIISTSQTKGRGRRGREFFSPKGTGIYISFVLYPSESIEKATGITCRTATAVCRAIEETTGIAASIKWVNDIFVQDKKVAGILTEAVTSIEDYSLSYVIVGIGINVYEPPEGFPKDIKKIAGALQDNRNSKDLLNELSASLIYHIIKNQSADKYMECLEDYKQRLFLTGNYVKIMQYNNSQTKASNDYAYVLGIDDEYHLHVRYDDGREDYLSTGEVSVVRY